MRNKQTNEGRQAETDKNSERMRKLRTMKKFMEIFSDETNSDENDSDKDNTDKQCKVFLVTSDF